LGPAAHGDARVEEGDWGIGRVRAPARRGGGGSGVGGCHGGGGGMIGVEEAVEVGEKPAP
jgi:hypothetical protein